MSLVCIYRVESSKDIEETGESTLLTGCFLVRNVTKQRRMGSKKKHQVSLAEHTSTSCWWKLEVCLCCRRGRLLQRQLHPRSDWRPFVSVRPLQRRRCRKQQVWHEQQGAILQLWRGLQVPTVASTNSQCYWLTWSVGYLLQISSHRRSCILSTLGNCVSSWLEG